MERTLEIFLGGGECFRHLDGEEMLGAVLDQPVGARAETVKPDLRGGIGQKRMGIVQRLDHGFHDLEQLGPGGFPGHFGPGGGHDHRPVDLLLVEEDVVIAVGPGKDVEVGERGVRRRLGTGRGQRAHPAGEHVRGGPFGMNPDPVLPFRGDVEHLAVAVGELGRAARGAGPERGRQGWEAGDGGFLVGLQGGAGDRDHHAVALGPPDALDRGGVSDRDEYNGEQHHRDSTSAGKCETTLPAASRNSRLGVPSESTWRRIRGLPFRSESRSTAALAGFRPTYTRSA